MTAPIRWLGEPLAKIAAGPGALKPALCVLADVAIDWRCAG
jgi:hypothetical protein